MLINCVARVRGDEKSAGGAVDLEERKIVRKRDREREGEEERGKGKKMRQEMPQFLILYGSKRLPVTTRKDAKKGIGG